MILFPQRIFPSATKYARRDVIMAFHGGLRIPERVRRLAVPFNFRCARARPSMTKKGPRSGSPFRLDHRAKPVAVSHAKLYLAVMEVGVTVMPTTPAPTTPAAANHDVGAAVVVV